MRRSLFVPFLTASAMAIEMGQNATLGNGLAPEPSCFGTSTYSFTPLNTIFVTVDGSYSYTGTINGSTPTDIFYTPPPPCSSVIAESTPSPVVTTLTIPVVALITMTVTSSTNVCTPRSSSAASITTSTQRGPYLNTTTTTSASSISEDCTLSFATFRTIYTETTTSPHGHPNPLVPTNAEPLSSVVVTSTIAASAPFAQNTAVTVTVTKKTPVLVPTVGNGGGNGGGGGGGAGSGPTFPGNTQGPTISLAKTSSRPNNIATSKPGGTTAAGNIPGLAPSNSPGNGNGNSNNAIPSNNPTVVPAPASPANNAGGSNNNNGGGSNGGASLPTVTGGSDLESIITSASKSPFSIIIGATTSLGAASPTVTLLGGVPVQVGSSSVYIGGSNVALPTGTSAALVTIAGQTFTVLPSAVVVGTSTLGLVRSESISYSAVQAAAVAASTITKSGVVITIEPTAAVVSGTTYTIGLNAPSTTAVVNGQTLTFDNSGVVLGSSTFAPALVTAPAYVVTTIGALTISIDQSQAIISGTTYAIGAGSSNQKTTAVVDGTTITFGSSGIILPSTTIAPTDVQLTGLVTAKTSASVATRIASNTSGAAMSSAAAALSISRPPSFLSSALCIVSMTFAFAALSLGLML